MKKEFEHEVLLVVAALLVIFPWQQKFVESSIKTC